MEIKFEWNLDSQQYNAEGDFIDLYKKSNSKVCTTETTYESPLTLCNGYLQFGNFEMCLFGSNWNYLSGVRSNIYVCQSCHSCQFIYVSRSFTHEHARTRTRTRTHAHTHTHTHTLSLSLSLHLLVLLTSFCSYSTIKIEVYVFLPWKGSRACLPAESAPMQTLCLSLSLFLSVCLYTTLHFPDTILSFP